MGNKQSGAVSKKEQKEMSEKFGIPMDQIKEMLNNFRKRAGADGTISKEQFRELLKGLMSDDLVDKVFTSFDKDGSGTMDEHEYLFMMGVTRGNNIEQKLRASFKMFDTDGNGALDPSEIREMFTLIINQRRAAQNPGKPLEPLNEKTVASINNIVREVFIKIDKNKSGTISLEEFIAGFNEYPEICGFFKQF